MALNWDNIEIISDESEPITVTAEERMIIVSGQPGQNGKNGKAATVKIGKTTTLPAGSQATVVNRGTETDAVLEFGIPRGSSGGSGGGAAAWGEIEGSLSNQTDLADALSRKADASSLGSLASKNSVDYETEVANKPALGTMASVNDAPSNGNEYVRKNGVWAVASGGGGTSAAEWGDITGTLSDQTDLKNALDAKANSADTYTKTQADNLLAGKANSNDVYSKSAVYSKTETETLLNAKADTADVYTKSETDDLLSDKLSSVSWGDVGGTLANQTDLQSALTAKADATTVYTKTQTDSLLSAKANSADLGDLAEKDSVNYETEVTNKPTLGTMSAVDDAPSNGSEYVRKNGAWTVASGGGSVSAAWGQITGTLSDQTDLANALSAKANSADVYTKTQTDNLLAGKANASNVYSKTETDNLLAGKLSSVAWGDIGGTLANQADLQSALTSKADASSVYTKTETDALLNAKANTADLGDLATQDTVDYTTDVTNKPTLGGIQVRPDYEIVDSTNEPTDGVTSLATGKIIFVYEA